MLQPVGPNFHFALLKHRDRLPGNGVAVFFLQMVMSSWISNWSYLHSLRPVLCSSPVFTFSRSSHIKHFVFPCLYTLSVSLFWKLRSYINCLIGQRILLWGVWFICAFMCWAVEKALTLAWFALWCVCETRPVTSDSLTNEVCMCLYKPIYNCLTLSDQADTSVWEEFWEHTLCSCDWFILITL